MRERAIHKRYCILQAIILLHVLIAGILTGRTIMHTGQNLVTGDMWNSIFGLTSGPQYFVFNLTAQILTCGIYLFCVICSATCCCWLHSKITGFECLTSKDDRKKQKWPLIVTAIFTTIFAVSGFLSLAGFSQMQVTPMMEDAGASALCLMIFGPIFIVICVGIAIAIVISTITAFAMQKYAKPLVTYIWNYQKAHIATIEAIMLQNC